MHAALLSLLAEAADEGPVLCLVDDIQWADQGSVDAVMFAARRLEAEGVVVLLARRTEGTNAADVPLRGIDTCELGGLAPDDALALVRGESWPLPQALEATLLANSAGNPLALLELPRVLQHLPTGTAVPDPLPVSEGIRRAFPPQISSLPAAAQTTLLIAATDSGADRDEVVAVMELMGVGREALMIAEKAGLVRDVDRRLTFRHPLLRSVAYHDATSERRNEVHTRFAEALSDERHGPRQVWHRSMATSGVDDDLATDLETSAEQSPRSRSPRGRLVGIRALRAATVRRRHGQRGAWRRRPRLPGSPASPGGPAACSTEPASSAMTQTFAQGSTSCAGPRLRVGSPGDAHAFLSSAARHVARTDPVKAVRILTEAGESASYAGDSQRLMETGEQAAHLLDSVTGSDRFRHWCSRRGQGRVRGCRDRSRHLPRSGRAG